MLEFISRLLSFSPISSIRILQTKLTFDVKYFEIWIYFHKWQWGSSLLFIVKYCGEHNWRAIILKKITPPETCFENHPKKNPKESTRISHQRTFIKKYKHFKEKRLKRKLLLLARGKVKGAASATSFSFGKLGKREVWFCHFVFCQLPYKGLSLTQYFDCLANWKRVKSQKREVWFCEREKNPAMRNPKGLFQIFLVTWKCCSGKTMLHPSHLQAT